METLRFTIKKQHIELKENPDIVSGTQNYLRASFEFDSSWAGYKKIAIFSGKYYREINNGYCMVPDEAAKEKIFSVKVAGQKDNIRNLTDFAIVKQR